MSKDKTYTDYAKKLANFARTKLNHLIMMGADRINAYSLKQLPKDVILLDWNYKIGHNWEERCSLLTHGRHEMYIVEGKCALCSIGCRTLTLIAHCREAALAGANFSLCKGFLIAYLGDYGHHNPPSCSILGFIIGAENGWSGGSLGEAESSNKRLETKYGLMAESSGWAIYGLARSSYRIGLAWISRFPTVFR